MTDEKPNPRVSNRLSPLAVIVVIILIGIVVVAVVKTRGHHVTPDGTAVPMAAPSNAVMPEQPNLPNHVVAHPNTNDAVEASPTGNEVGNPGAGGIGNTSR